MSLSKEAQQEADEDTTAALRTPCLERGRHQAKAPPAGVLMKYSGSRVRLKFLSSAPQMASRTSTQALGTAAHSWPNASRDDWRAGRNSVAPSASTSCVEWFYS